MEFPTLPQRFLDTFVAFDSPRAQIHKINGRWDAISAREMLRRVARLSCALADLGVREGDRVAIFAANSPEWHTADFAVLGLGAVVVPIYFRESPERIEYIVNHSGAKVVFASGALQVARLGEIRGRLASVEHAVMAAPAIEEETLSPGTHQYENLVAPNAERDADAIASYRQHAAALKSSQLASIIYTSGTTGEPKGVMLSHSNFVSNEIGSFFNFVKVPDELALSFLPLAHVYERLTDYCYLFAGVPIAYVERPEDVTQAMLEVRPTIMAAVPRFFEKLYAAVMERGAHAKGFRRALFDWSIGVVRKAVPWKAYGKPVFAWTKWEWSVADRLVYKKFRAGVGGRIRVFVSGGAPLARELAEFITTVGMPVAQGYGLTETSPVISSNMIVPNHIGTVGYPLKGIEVRIAEDGELLVRGPCVMMGYYKKPEETAAVISADGWLSTGDIARLDEDGYLTITDRKKELLKTAGGKLVAPAPVENALKTSPFIANAALEGDRRRFIAALIVPNRAAVEARAAAEGVKFGSPAELVASPWVHKLIEGEITRLTANLAQYETIKRFALIERDFTFDNGELTYTMKLKRRVIEQHYANVIERLYTEPAMAHQVTGE